MVSFTRRSAQATSVVILALAEQPATWRYGHELCQQLDLTPGRLYQALMRLADLGLLEAAWESDAPADRPADRPPRHRYRLSGPGRAHAAELAAELARVPANTARVAGGIVGGIGRRSRRPRLEGT